MRYDVPKCKITVVKRTLNHDLADKYLDAEGLVACEKFSDGQ